MRRSQYELLQIDLEKALLEISAEEIELRRGFVEMALEEYDELPDGIQNNPVSILNSLYADRPYVELAILNVMLAKLLNQRIEEKPNKHRKELVDFAFQAINQSTIYREKTELAEKRQLSAEKRKNTDTAKRLNSAKHEALNQLVSRILE